MRRRHRRASQSIIVCVLGCCLLACAVGAERSDAASRPASSRAGAEFTIDRRPVFMLRTWNGSYTDENPLGLSPGYRGDDAGREMAQALTRQYARGWRRFMLHTPTGGPPDATLSKTVGEWWSRSEAWRTTMTRELSAWLDEHPDATLGIYTGLRLRNGAMPDDETLARCLQPWLDIGLTEFAFDATSPVENRDEFLRVQSWLRERGARAIMEAYPVDRARGVVEEAWLARTPMVAAARYETLHDPDDRWVFDPATTEVWVSVGIGGGPTLEEARDYVRRGYVLFVYSIDENQRFNALRAATEGRQR
jgi:hypothetical protein